MFDWELDEKGLLCLRAVPTSEGKVFWFLQEWSEGGDMQLCKLLDVSYSDPLLWNDDESINEEFDFIVAKHKLVDIH